MNFVTQFTKLEGIPMTTGWTTFIGDFLNMSSHMVCSLWMEMIHSLNEDELVVDHRTVFKLTLNEYTHE